MAGRRTLGILKRGLQATGIVLSVIILVPLITGRPLVSYPISESMTPTLGPFDVFLVNPYPREMHVGDIILFSSVTTGQPAVHRIVGGDAEGGWVTKGDANAIQDQMNIEPLVTHDRVMGRVVTGPSGAPIIIPKLGHTLTRAHIEMVRFENAVGGADKLASAVIVISAVVLFLPTFARPDRRASERPPSIAIQRRLRFIFPRGVLGWHVGLALLALLSASIGIAIHAAHTDLPLEVIVVGAVASSDGVRAANPGQSVLREVEAGSLAFLPTFVLLEPASSHVTTDGRAVRVEPWHRAVLQARETAGSEHGIQRDQVTVWRYPAVLPESWTVSLHNRMPGLPDIVLGACATAVGALWLVALGAVRRPVGRELGLREAWR
ncbi:MAG: S26 family signal peptidase [Candidatus Thermoplasmatota archaeon]